jgi:hypothetical protein
MTRGRFLRSIIVALVAPSVIAEAKLDISEPIMVGLDMASGPAKNVIVLTWKLTVDLLEDPSYANYLFDKKTSPMLREAKRLGIDLDKPYEFDVGYVDDDFVYNYKTLVIRQTV